MKKAVVFVLAMLTVLVIVSCSKDSSAKAESAQPTKLLYIHGSSETSILQATAVHFKELDNMK
jgi:outer membrane protein assembly factor BamD (BamD/ComL family)